MYKKILGACTVLLIAGAAIFGSVTVANAAGFEDPAIDETSQTEALVTTEEAVQALTVIEETPLIVVDTTPYVLIAWAMPSWINATTPSWPQGVWSTGRTPITIDLATKNLNALDETLAASVPCEVTWQWQIDGNYDTVPVRDAIAGGNLIGPGNPAEALWGGGGGEAYKLVQITGPKCEVPPVPCTATGTKFVTYDPNDLPPVKTPSGLYFEGNVKAVDTYLPVTGNLQGISGVGYTVEPGATGYGVQIVFEVDPNTDLDATPGDNGYATVSTLALNGSGTFSNLELQPIWYTSKIAYASQGGQGNPLTLAALAAIMKNNTLSTQGLHLQTGASVADKATVSAFTSNCGSFNFKWAPLPKDKTDKGQTTDGGFECGDTTVETSTEYTDYTYSYGENGGVVETKTVRTEPGVRDLDETEIYDCPVTDTLGEGLFTDKCGIDNDGYTTPEDTKQLDYSVVDSRVNGVGNVTITLAANIGYFLPEDAVTEWSHDFTNEACTVITEIGDSLAYTGVNGKGIALGAIAALAVIATGVILLINRRKKDYEPENVPTPTTEV